MNARFGRCSMFFDLLLYIQRAENLPPRLCRNEGRSLVVLYYRSESEIH